MGRFLGVLFVLVLVVLAFFMVDIRKTDDGRMPVVTVGDGELPKFDVDVGSIELKQEEKTVNVPDVQVGTHEKKIALPKVQVKGPDQE